MSDDVIVVETSDTPRPITTGAKRGRPKGSTNRRRSTEGTAGITQTETTKAYGKLLMCLSYAIIWSRLKRLQIPDVGGDLADTLSLEVAEAEDIAKPLARMTLANPQVARIAAPVVKNTDVIDAVWTLIEYNQRVERQLATFARNTQIQTPGVSQNGSTQQATPDGQPYVPFTGWAADYQP